ncbi:MAG: tRNA-intron lyase [Candidatus Caldarchaeum sp.]|nr:tRNA-intron lyase [Candidatus Caldarchaeum sp.]
MAEGELLRDSVVVWDVEDSRKLFSEGFYGKPLGIPKPRDIGFDAPLVLDLVEALYLQKKNKLEVFAQGEKIKPDELERHAQAIDENFPIKYSVYSDLRERGFIVLPGIKFGSDFAAYRHGPGIDHAPFIIQVKRTFDQLSALEIIRSGRLATSVRKHFTVAVPTDERVSYVLFEWWKA